MDQIILQILNGLDKGSAYALIALGLTLIFGTLGVVNFAHGALFMLGAFCAVTLSRILTISNTVIDETKKDFLGNPLKVEVPYVNDWFGEAAGQAIIDWSVPLSILFAIPVMIAIGVIMGTRPNQTFLQTSTRRSDPCDIRPSDRFAGNRQVLLWCEPNPNPSTRSVYRFI